MNFTRSRQSSAPQANNTPLGRERMTLYLLLAVPMCIYGISYGYLAYYHGSLNLFQTVIHEGGTHTLLETMFYAPHFLGHVPVYTVLALYFTGVYLAYQDKDASPSRDSGFLWGILLILFLAGSFVLSIKHFGSEYTYSYIFQSRQSVSRYEPGGAWNLHLPITVLLFFLIPVYIYSLNVFLGKNIGKSSHGSIYIILSVLAFILMTVVVNDDVKVPFLIWENPRYLAHSVRELATFPATYFPIVFFLFCKERLPYHEASSLKKSRQSKLIYIFLIIFLFGFGYQVLVSLSSGIGTLAQKPSFAKGGSLGIPYLLSSHYFEHVLDTIYFILLSLFLFALRKPHVKDVRASDPHIGSDNSY